MSNPIVIGYHLVWTAYGWWFPNDPRGSMSKFIASDALAEIAELHYGRRRIQPSRTDLRKFFQTACNVLDYAPMLFGTSEVDAIAAAFADLICEERYTCYACVIMPDHVHILIRKHKHLAEEMIANLQRESHLRLRELGLRDMDHPIWGGPGWKVFLDSPEDVRRTIKYIDDNPIKMRLPQQNWAFVTPYNDWPFHEGHNPDSPYAKRRKTT